MSCYEARGFKSRIQRLVLFCQETSCCKLECKDHFKVCYCNCLNVRNSRVITDNSDILNLLANDSDCHISGFECRYCHFKFTKFVTTYFQH